MPHEDEVDRIVGAWARERPDLDFAPLDILSRLRRLGRHLERIRRSAFATAGLEPWEFDVLAALRRTGDPHELSPTALSAETMVTSGTMTNRIDRLLERGLVERRDAPNDRRGVLVVMTDRGRRHVDAAMEALLGAEVLILDGISPEDQSALAASLRSLSRDVSGL
jgi:DNA-binding MarR family transcriptional regulator